MAEQIKHYPGPNGVASSGLDTVKVGRRYECIGKVADFRATLWPDGDVTLKVESGAMSMQLSASYAELSALRDMLTAAMADMPETMREAA